VLAVVLSALLACCWFLPRPTGSVSIAGWRPSTLAVPRAILPVFITSATAVTAGYAQGAVLLALGTQIARDLIGSHDAFVNGASLTLFAVVTAATALVARRLSGALAIALGGAVAVLGLAALTLAAQERSMPIYLAATALAGVGYSLLFLGGLTLINAHAPPQHRGGTLSAIYLIGYLMMGAIALTLGVTATHHGLAVALGLGASGIGALSIAAAVLAVAGTLDMARKNMRRRRTGRRIELET
jgi:hypothetical protein